MISHPSFEELKIIIFFVHAALSHILIFEKEIKLIKKQKERNSNRFHYIKTAQYLQCIASVFYKFKYKITT